MGSQPSGAPIDAVTVALLRDVPRDELSSGPEVLLLERHAKSSFMPGALVFPGGKVDALDAELPPSRWRCSDLGAWVELLGVPDERAAVAMLTAAVRETFEESGVLLACRADGQQLARSPLDPDRVVDVRRSMTARDQIADWRPWLEQEGLVLDFDSLVMWSWWLTPAGLPQRFDTRFLVATLPPGQKASHDGVELVSSTWLQPAEALLMHEAGECELRFPTRCTLEQIDAYPSAAAAIAAARQGRTNRNRFEAQVITIVGWRLAKYPDGRGFTQA
jgi:8-oxo-dGTP pyrophosphatase MutT (NUDIX family)